MTTNALTGTNQPIIIDDIKGLSLRWPIDGDVAPFGSASRPAITQPLLSPSPRSRNWLTVGELWKHHPGGDEPLSQE